MICRVLHHQNLSNSSPWNVCCLCAGGAVDVVSYLERFPKLPALMSFGDFCAVFPYPPEDPLWSFTSAKVS